MIRFTNAAVLVLLSAAIFAAPAESPVLPMAKVTLTGVHGRIAHLTADYYHARLFVAAAGNDTVEVIDVRTNSLLPSIHDVAEPHSIAYLKSVNRLLVTNGGDGSLRTFDGTTLKPLNKLYLGQDPGMIGVDSAHGRVYVGYGEGVIAVFDSAGKRLAGIALKSHPEGFQLAANQPRLFVNMPDSHTIGVVDTEHSQLIAEWPLAGGQENFPLAIDEERRRVFVACRRPSRLIVFDMDTGREIARMPTVGDADDLFYDAIHRRVYAVGGRGQIAIYSQRSADRYDQLDSLPTVAGARTGLFVPEWNRLFVAIRDFGARPAEIRIYQPQ